MATININPDLIKQRVSLAPAPPVAPISPGVQVSEYNGGPSYRQQFIGAALGALAIALVGAVVALIGSEVRKRK